MNCNTKPDPLSVSLYDLFLAMASNHAREVLAVAAASCILRFSFTKDMHNTMVYVWRSVALSMLRLGDVL